MTLTACSLTSSPASTNASECHRSTQRLHIASWTRRCASTTTLCLKYRRRVGRDNTVKYRWRTLQLLPGTDRPSYAGAVVDVLEGLDDSWQCSTRGRSSPRRRHRSAPISCATSPREPRILLRLISTAMAWADKLAQLDVHVPRDTADGHGAGRVRKAVSPRRRKPTPLQTARLRAVRKLSARGCPFVASPGNWAYTGTL